MVISWLCNVAKGVHLLCIKCRSSENMLLPMAQKALLITSALHAKALPSEYTQADDCFALCLSRSYTFQQNEVSQHITSILKSGDLSIVSNYRPVSFLCSRSKVLEVVVFEMVCAVSGAS